MLYEYIIERYEPNEPIFASELKIEGMTDGNIRQQLKRLSDSEVIKRYDTGIYFIPKKSIFKTGAQLALDDVIRKKYLEDNKEKCGYICGISFANQIGITTQVPMCYEVVTNKATKDYRELTIAKSRVTLRKPKVKITEENCKALQLLDLIKSIDILSEIPIAEVKGKLITYMRNNQLTFESLANYLSYYPDKIYRNLYEVGLLSGVSTLQQGTIQRSY